MGGIIPVKTIEEIENYIEEQDQNCIVAGEEQPVKKKLVLVFDDFERCKIGVIDLLGIINTYVEDKRIKTIVIASEDNIEDEENYKTFKEKVVHTFKIYQT